MKSAFQSQCFIFFAKMKYSLLSQYRPKRVCLLTVYNQPGSMRGSAEIRGGVSEDRRLELLPKLLPLNPVF